MSFKNVYGGRRLTRRAYVLADGRVASHSAGEKELGDMLSSLGYPPILDKDWKTRRVHIPAAWTEGKYDHDIELEPDWIVDVAHEFVATPCPGRSYEHWVVNYDAWSTHNRTLGQQKRDDRHDIWYGKAGYHVVHVGDNHFQNFQAKTDLRPKLIAALMSDDPVVQLAR